MKASVFNIGCKVNQYECDIIAQELSKRGYDVTLDLCKADLYVINTCAVTAEAEKKSRQAIARCNKLNDKCTIFVCGCATEKSADTFVKKNVQYISGVAEKTKIVDIIDKKFANESIINIDKLPKEYENNTLTQPSRTRAYVKIQDGCNNFCSYCIIPYLRGKSRSREIAEIVKEIKLLANSTQEIVLTGINMSQYGLDIGTNLTNLIKSLCDIDIRIRLGSFYVEAISAKLLTALFALKNFCPHFHLSLQSGDNKVLKDMNRRYSTDDYFSAINLIRSFDNNASITTDIIVGYPTEEQENFENTVDFIKKVGFSDIHIFPYSKRDGTVASNLKVLDNNIIKERKAVLIALKNNLIKQYLTKNIGKKQQVLIESSDGEYNYGYSNYYIKIYTKQQGELQHVMPCAIYKDGLKEEL